LPVQVAEEMGITVVPIYVRFGGKVYRDRVDISEEEFYQKLDSSEVHPTTSQPTPSDFAEAYNRLAKDTDKIVSIHLSSKTSGTYSAALMGRDMVNASCHIEVVDSRSVSMGVGLMAMAAARLAVAEGGLQEIISELKEAITSTRIFGLLDSLKYVLMGGRLGKAKALLGSMLNVRPLLTMRDGVLFPAGLARTRNKGVERLYELVRNTAGIQELAIVHSTTPAEAGSLGKRVAPFLEANRIHLARLGPALGVHGGPGTLILALRDRTGKTEPEFTAGENDTRKGFSLPSLRLPKLSCSYPDT